MPLVKPTVGSDTDTWGPTLNTALDYLDTNKKTDSMTTARVLGRTTASTGAIEEISIGPGLSLASGVLGAPAVAFLSTVGDVTGFVAACNTSVTLSGANTAIFLEIVPKRNLLVSSLNWVVTTQSGNYDIGIYSAAGTRLWSKGSTAVPAGGTQQNETVSPAVQLTAGTSYYIAWTADNTTASARGITPVAGFLAKKLDGTSPAFTLNTAFPLPSTATLSSTSGIRYVAISVQGT